MSFFCTSGVNTIYALTCLAAGKIAEGVESGRRAVALDSENFLAYRVLGIALSLSGQFEAAVAMQELALAMSGRHPFVMADLAMALADRGKSCEADAVYCELQARARREYVSPTMLALVASAATREEEAIRHAREAYEIHDPALIFFSRYYPGPRLYRYPWFREIIKQLGRSEWLRDPLPPEACREPPPAQE